MEFDVWSTPKKGLCWQDLLMSRLCIGMMMMLMTMMMMRV
jgi:hypothetical protein